MANLSHRKSHRLSRPRRSVFANLGRNLEIESRMIVAWLWAPLKKRLESMLRFGLRSNVTATISPEHFPGILSPRPDPGDRADEKPASSSTSVPIYDAKRMPKRFLAARHGDK